MTTTRTPATTPTHDARHCGHVSRSESATVKRAAILAECVTTVPGFVLPAGEPVAVLAVVEALLTGAACSVVGTLATLAGWEGDASVWADESGQAWLTLPSTPEGARAYGATATGLAFLLPALSTVVGR